MFRDQLWAVGGANKPGVERAVSSCEFLDVASNTWMVGPSMNNPRHSHSLAVLNGELWAVGGCPEESLLSCDRLDAATNVWVMGHDLPPAPIVPAVV